MLLRRDFLAIIPAALVAGASVPASGQASLDELRAQGVIAERYDGLVEIRADNPPPGAKQLVEETNAKRREIYRKRAESQDVSQEAVAKVYAEQIVQRAPDGTYFKKPDGSYIRK